MSAKISIILPVRNGAKTLARALDSLIKQADPRLEIIVIDGASSDGTQEIITSYAAKLAYWVSEPDGHTFIAFNKGLKQATGEIIGFMNADDWHEPDTLARVRQAFQDPELELLGGAVKLHRGSVYLGVSQPLPTERWDKECFLQIPVPHIATFLRKARFEQTGYFDERYRFAADQEYFCRLMHVKPKSLCSLEPLANVAIGGQTHGFGSLFEKYQIASRYGVPRPKRVYRFTRYAILSLITRFIMWARLAKPAARLLKLLGSRHGAF